MSQITYPFMTLIIHNAIIHQKELMTINNLFYSPSSQIPNHVLYFFSPAEEG
ncbi:hypothetical protein J2Y80_000196 [Bacillus velezensis]|nr:hypothetical protein [Bacillus velezensis]